MTGFVTGNIEWECGCIIATIVQLLSHIRLILLNMEGTTLTHGLLGVLRSEGAGFYNKAY